MAASEALAAAQTALPASRMPPASWPKPARKRSKPQKLPDDKDLAEAAAKLKARTDQLAAEVTSLC